MICEVITLLEIVILILVLTEIVILILVLREIVILILVLREIVILILVLREIVILILVLREIVILILVLREIVILILVLIVEAVHGFLGYPSDAVTNLTPARITGKTDYKKGKGVYYKSTPHPSIHSLPSMKC